MVPSLVQPYEHLLATLTKFAASMRSSQPAGRLGARWSRVAQQLEQELRQLRSHAATERAQAGVAAEQAELKKLAQRLTQLARALDGLRSHNRAPHRARHTQLARAQDGLPFQHSTGAPAEQLLGERRLVVLAAWQLQQALEQIPDMLETASATIETAVAG